MRIEHIKSNLEKRRKIKAIEYHLGDPARHDLIELSQSRLNLEFPDQVRLFYQHYNGLSIVAPRIEILPLEKLERELERVSFSFVSTQERICFDVSHINRAGQWDILNADTNFLITLTFASFWSNKIWAWIDKNRRFWEP